jgi:hypothetical protein
MITPITGCVTPVRCIRIQPFKNDNSGIVPPWLQQQRTKVVHPHPIVVDENTPVVMRKA